MKLKKNIAVSETGFLFDPTNGESYNLNKTGQLIFKMIGENMSEQEIIDAILQDYDIEPNSLHRYFDDFTLMLNQFNLTENE